MVYVARKVSFSSNCFFDWISVNNSGSFILILQNLDLFERRNISSDKSNARSRSFPCCSVNFTTSSGASFHLEPRVCIACLCNVVCRGLICLCIKCVFASPPVILICPFSERICGMLGTTWHGKETCWLTSISIQIEEEKKTSYWPVSRLQPLWGVCFFALLLALSETPMSAVGGGGGLGHKCWLSDLDALWCIIH